METFNLVATILGISAVFSILNSRILRLPETIGLMATGLMASVAVLLIGTIFPASIEGLCHRVATFDFSFFVLTIAIGFLIFAGALSSDASAMSRDRWPILIFATFGILLSTFLVGGMTFGVLLFLGIKIPFIHCLLFGALISPTDPIAVLAILKETAVPKSLQADIGGESLLNDGVAVVVFLTVLQLAGGGHGGESHATESIGFVHIVSLFGREVIGGALLGGVFGVVTIFLMRLIKVPSIDILLSLAAVMGCYSLASIIHVSGPLALVVTGLIVGTRIHGNTFSRTERVHLDHFWEAIDHIFNAVLFTLMGFVLLGLSDSFELKFILAGVLAIPVVLLARVISVALPLPFTKLRHGNPRATIAVLSWGGLRGGISIALVLSLTPELSRNLLLHLTYVVVVFSILGQGLTIGPMVRYLKMGETTEQS
jgi:CPA1 family monovalent cation:H+ antiporter